MRRKMILDIIKDNPGIGFNGISRHSKLSNGVVSHYILQLLKNDEITKSGIRAKYFLKDIPIKHRELIIILSTPTNFRIIKVLLEKKNSIKNQKYFRTHWKIIINSFNKFEEYGKSKYH